MKNVIAFVFALSLAACGGEEPLNPVGTYSLAATFGAGDCVLPGTMDTDTLTIVDEGGRYRLSTGDPNEAIQGTITCAEACTLSATSRIVGEDFSGEAAYNYMIMPDGLVTGSGSLAFSVPAEGFTCSQVFTVSGRKI
jgi:hypothetical protein